MIHPCDQCGGTGIIPRSLESVGGRCPRCADTSERPCPTKEGTRTINGLDWQTCHICDGRGRFKPDPDTVMRWCFTHESVMDDDDTVAMLEACQKVVMERLLAVVNLGPCEVGWVERPTRLEVAE